MGLDHCHGTVIEHPDGTFECTEGCEGGRAVHEELVTCGDLELGCCPTFVLDDDRRDVILVPAA
jgi:hypothetical protein